MKYVDILFITCTIKSVFIILICGLIFFDTAPFDAQFLNDYFQRKDFSKPLCGAFAPPAVKYERSKHRTTLRGAGAKKILLRK